MSPGSRISASDEIVLGDGCMLANGAYITDSDWHGLYNRIDRDEAPTPVRLGDNVWVVIMPPCSRVSRLAITAWSQPLGGH
ncbi:MAG: hypothetical protein CM15mP74_15740 [Halieaceae bacterium]|nr:MAG: hypothetical protein CM15mP74_15740 [Halieaceae bacterium]